MAKLHNHRRPESCPPDGASPGGRRPHWHSRGVLLIVMFVLSLLGVALYAGPARIVVFDRLLTDGGILGLWIGGAIGLGHFSLRITGLRQRKISAALQCSVAAATGLGIMSLVVLGLGLAGRLNAFTAWSILAVGWTCGILSVLSSAPSARTSAIFEALKEPVRWEWLWLLATPFLAQAIIAAVVPAGLLWQPEEPHGYDVAEYHLQVPREWYAAGCIIPLHHNVFSYFPFNVEMHYLLAMHLRGGPWAGMYLAQLMHVTFMALAVLAVYGIARGSTPAPLHLSTPPVLQSSPGPLHPSISPVLQYSHPPLHLSTPPIAPPGAATIAGLAMLGVPWITQLAGIAYDEGGFLLFSILAIGIALLANADPERRLRRFALAGLMAGFAAGSKLTAVPEVLVAVPVVIGVMALWRMLVPSPLYTGERVRVRGQSPEERTSSLGPSPQPSPPGTGEREQERNNWRTLWLGIVIFVLFGLASFSPWMLRNLAWARNPVFPELMPLLGQDDFNSKQVHRWELAHKAPPAEQPIRQRIEKFKSEIVLGWQFGYLLLPLGMIAFALAIRRPGAWYLLGLLVILTVFWLFFTHLQGRFFIVAVPIAALMLAQCNWRRALPVVAMIVIVFCGFAWWQINGRLLDRLKQVNNDKVRALGVEDLSALLLGDIAPEGLPDGVKLVLIGDARAFWYPVPMSRLSYRTVFDVKGDAPDFLTAWGGPQINEPGTWIVIDPKEIRRFLRTYHDLPAVPADVLQREETYVIKR